jgi:small-conductance mechanosensitive channel
MNKRQTLILVGTMLAIGIMLGLGVSTLRPGPVHREHQPIQPPSDLILTAKIVISFVNIFLVLSLLVIYVDIYRALRSRFTVGLIVTILALLVYAITSSPILQLFLGYPISGPGPFLFIPDIFTAIAASLLIYLSLE